MSLLNQVLQDLEKRNANDFHVHRQQLNYPYTAYKPRKRILFGVVIIFTLLLSSTLILYLTKFQKDSGNATLSQKESPNSVSKTPTPITPTTKNATDQPSQVKKAENPLTGVKLVQPERIQQQTAVRIPSRQPEEQKTQPQNISTKPTPQIRKTFSRQQLAEQLFKTAQTQTSQQKTATLAQAIELNPQHINAYLLLINTLLKQGKTVEAATILDQGLKVFPQNLTLISQRSQLFLQQDNAQSALTLLHAINQQIQNETLLSLLAVAYQKTGGYTRSLQHYQKLITINPHKYQYWLGLAIAQEKLGHKQQALEAYHQALLNKPLKPSIVSYIKQRINILG